MVEGAVNIYQASPITYSFQLKRKECNMVIDPVCGMEIEEAEAAASRTYKGKTYYFCSQACREKFEQNPEEYIEEH